MTKRTYHIIFLLLLSSSLALSQKIINCDLIIENDDLYITNYTASPGDTLCLMAGNRPHLYLRDIMGAQDTPVVLINHQGISNIESFEPYGIRFANSRFIKITGTGSNAEYGIQIDTVSIGDGIDINSLSSDVEIDHIKIQNIKYAGIKVKTDPNCTFRAVRDSFTLYNVHIHDNYLSNIGTEGLYIGSSFFLGQYISDCDTSVLPHLIDGVRIYRNKLNHIGWDGIQVGSALNACEIYDNEINHDSFDEHYHQMSGIMVNPGSRCDVYNNQIINGKGTGIINQGAGGQFIYNNLIVNAGRDYYMDDQVSKQQFGIFSKYQYIHPEDSSYYIFNNTIINPKSDGIRYFNKYSKSNLIINNIIINPGAFDFYETNGSLNNEGVDSYIHNYLHESDLILANNLKERNASLQHFEDTLMHDYHLTWRSPAHNSGYNLSDYHISFDLDRNTRPYDNYFDIGAYELQSAENIEEVNENNIHIIPNPVKNKFILQIDENTNHSYKLNIYSVYGAIILSRNIRVSSGISDFIDLNDLSSGFYFVEIENKDSRFVKRFLKR